jgi:tRNA pseudouridine55 synthase
MDETFVPNEELGEVLLLDKPLGWTSFDVVKKIRAAGRFKKIGHAGTLDPLATGLLVCCTGPKTKTISDIQGAEKEYTATITLGGTTASFDLETEVVLTEPTPSPPTPEDIKRAISTFLGTIEQVPPTFSAVRVDGKRAYVLARKGVEAKIAAKTITIHAFDVLAYDYPNLFVRIVCSKGTYIRSIARDLGQVLGTGGYLSALRRNRIGNFSVEDSWPVAKLAERLRFLRETAQKTSDSPIIEGITTQPPQSHQPL